MSTQEEADRFNHQGKIERDEWTRHFHEVFADGLVRIAPISASDKIQLAMQVAETLTGLDSIDAYSTNCEIGEGSATLRGYEKPLGGGKFIHEPGLNDAVDEFGLKGSTADQVKKLLLTSLQKAVSPEKMQDFHNDVAVAARG